MKRMLKIELAEAAGVSRRSFSRFLREHKKDLEERGQKSKDHYLKPEVIKYICEAYGIDEEELKAQKGQ